MKLRIVPLIGILLGTFVTSGNAFAQKIMSTNIYATQFPTIGFARRSFPRDPIAINQFAEHMFVGQILQPLTDTDQLGNVIPSVASKWHFEEEGKRIVFEIDQSIKFSTGKNINSKDVKYTLDVTEEAFQNEVKAVKIMLEEKEESLKNAIRKFEKEQFCCKKDAEKEFEKFIKNTPYLF